MCEQLKAFVIRMLLVFTFLFQGFLVSALANEAWIPPMKKDQDKMVGNWAVTNIGEAHFSFGLPDNMKDLVAAKVVFIGKKDKDITYDLYMSVAQNGEAQDVLTFSKKGQMASLLKEQVLEIDMTDFFKFVFSEISRLRPGFEPGKSYIGLHFTTKPKGEGLILGLRFQYEGDTDATDDFRTEICNLYKVLNVRPPDPELCPFQKIVFVTSQTYNGALGGIAGADKKCQQSADDAGLPGTYRAWISTSDSDPRKTFTKIASSYILVGGTEVAAGWADLTDGNLKNPISLDQKGLPIVSDPELPSNSVWSNTDITGAALEERRFLTCADWRNSGAGSPQLRDTGRVGLLNETSDSWTDSAHDDCGERRRLYCFQQ